MSRLSQDFERLVAQQEQDNKKLPGPHIPAVLRALLHSDAIQRIKAVRPTGSSYTCDPPVHNTDVDFLILLHEESTTSIEHTCGPVMDFMGALSITEWTECSSKTEDGAAAYVEDDNYSETWYAARYCQYNLIFTADPDWFIRAVAATEVCRAFNVLDKEKRKEVFRTIRDGSDEYDISVIV